VELIADGTPEQVMKIKIYTEILESMKKAERRPTMWLKGVISRFTAPTV
jgi:hypothetical protein